MQRKLLFSAALLILSCEQVGAYRQGQQEQTSFGTEVVPGEQRVKRPVPVSDTILQILRTDDAVKSCLEYNPLPAGQSLGLWFIASEIHLDGPAEADLVVVPRLRGEETLCFQSVEGIGWFWIFRPTGSGYTLALKAAGNGLWVLKTRHNGYRDVQSGSIGQAGRFVTTITFRFDRGQYRESRNVTRETPQANPGGAK